MIDYLKKCSLVALAFFCLLDTPADAITTYRGSRLYFTLLGTNIKFPIFTKEFTESSSTIRVGGIKQLFLADTQQTLGFRLTRETIRPNGSGLGFSVTYWRGAFANESFLYAQQGQDNFIAEYEDPTHTYIFGDINFILIPWESGSKALGLYGLISLATDLEQYDIHLYTQRGDDPSRQDEISAARNDLHLRFAFGFGNRFYLHPRLSLWFEKRWIVGERFSVERTLGEGGLFEGGRNKTLYVPFNSVGLSLSF